MRFVIIAVGAGVLSACAANLEQPPRGDIRPIFSTYDYPSRALRNEEEGTVRVRLSIDEIGKVVGCDIVQSSDSKSIDERTCEVIIERMQFKPALDRKGRPVASTTMSPPIRWSLPDGGFSAMDEQGWTKYLPELPMGRRVNFEFGEAGRIDRCWVDGAGVDGFRSCDEEFAFGHELYNHLKLKSGGNAGIVTVIRGKGKASLQDVNWSELTLSGGEYSEIQKSALSDGEQLIATAVPSDAEIIERLIVFARVADGGSNCIGVDTLHQPDEHAMVACAAAAFYDKVGPDFEIRWEVIYRRPAAPTDPTVEALEELQAARH